MAFGRILHTSYFRGRMESELHMFKHSRYVKATFLYSIIQNTQFWT